MITIIQQPEQYTPAYNPMNYVVSSDNYTEPSFQYVFDLYVKGVFISRHRLPPAVFSNVAMLDVSGIVQSYLTHDFDYASSAFDRNYNSYADVYVRFGEEYSVSGVITTYINLVTSATCYAVNASLEYLSFVDWSNNTFYKGSTRKYLTNIAQPNVLENTSMWLHFNYDTPATIERIRVRTYTSAGTLINTNSFVPTDLSNIDLEDRFLRVSVGTKNLKSLFGSTFFDGASYYTIELVDAGASFSFELKRINIQESNCMYKNIEVHFLNVHGGFDVFNFKLSSHKESDIERKIYYNDAGLFNNSNEYIYSASDRTIQNMVSSNQDMIKANSDWISEEESIWLKELITSPVVFALIDNVLVPINLTETKYTFNKKVNKKLFNLQITFKYGNQNYRQAY